MSTTERPVSRTSPPDAGASGSSSGAGNPGVPMDLVAGLVLVAVAALFLARTGEGHLDWLFPVVLSYVAGALGLVLVVRGLLGRGRRVPAVPPILHGKGLDVAAFILLTVVYVVLLDQIGFWVPSFLAIFVGSVYLDTERSVRRVAVSAAVALAVCVLGYLLLTQVFYIPLPEGAWLPF